MRAVNLIPPEQRKGAGGTFGRSDGAAYVVVGFVAGVCLLGVVWARARHQIAQRTSQAAALTAQANRATAEASLLTPYQNFIALSGQRQQAVQELAGSRFDWAHAFHELGRVLPFDVSLISVAGSISAPAVVETTATTTTATTTTATATTTSGVPAVSPLSSSTPPGAVPSMQLQGCTTSQAEVALTLQRLSLMDGVQSVSLESSSQGATSSSPTAATPVTAASASTAPYCPDSFVVSVSFAPLPDPSGSSGSATTAGLNTTTTTTTSATTGGGS